MDTAFERMRQRYLDESDLTPALGFADWLGMSVFQVRAIPRDEVWFVSPGNPPRVLGKLVGIGTDSPQPAPGDAG